MTDGADNKQRVTLYEADLYDNDQYQEERVRLVLVKLSSEWYGIDILKTTGIVKVSAITYLPSAPKSIAGIVNLRGNIVSVTDLGAMLGIFSETARDLKRLVIVQTEGMETGILADEVSDIVDVPASKIEPALTTIEPEKASYLEGECRAGGKLIGILNIKKIIEAAAE